MSAWILVDGQTTVINSAHVVAYRIETRWEGGMTQAEAEAEGIETYAVVADIADGGFDIVSDVDQQAAVDVFMKVIKALGETDGVFDPLPEDEDGEPQPALEEAA